MFPQIKEGPLPSYYLYIITLHHQIQAIYQGQKQEQVSKIKNFEHFLEAEDTKRPLLLYHKYYLLFFCFAS